MDKVLAVIMGGGQGTRLFPLTKDRAKPAVPLAGKYRLVDIPISNCLNSQIRKIYLLTQFNSASLHRHIQETYKFDAFSGGFVDILAAQQSFDQKSGWYQGTADAVRQNFQHFDNHKCDYVVILSGDQLYRMDFSDLVSQHIEAGADITIATIPVNRSAAPALGIMQVDDSSRITRFVEKPKDPAVLDTLKMTPAQLAASGDPGGDLWLASMGIYVFSKDVLIEALNNDKTDFGKNIIPDAINTYKVSAYVYRGYWEDIGTIKGFFEANLDAASPLPQFDYFEAQAPIYTHPRYLPASKLHGASLTRVVLSDGCIIGQCYIENALIGIRSIIQEGSVLRDVVMMGADYYENNGDKKSDRDKGIPAVGIGHHCHITRAIIDKNARIGNDVRISPEGKPAEMDGPNFYVREGIVCIPKNAVVPDGTVI
ncbi:glucose-1-phosphate adenylyltransferase [Oscillatoria amoena NRMC-F 0135]|nr:glucose-1-phosphate adenylyltransferase [Oscillatoria amoena NRMC-F 0135]MDL5054844.1 glucose-1-phosphate adenylyltransferase [Oscillatoria laete-virens NRMC-F 0139]